MKKYIRSDESDYIRIGNRIIPKDASNLGDASYDKVSEVGRRNYEAEVAERKAAEERARITELGQGRHDLAFAEVDESASVEDQLQQLFDELVPNEGQCDNLGGELVRAMMRIMYRDYNDGDVFYEGYGLETCASDAAFIIDNSTDEISQILFDTASDGLKDDAYTQRLVNAASLLIDYLRENPQVFGMDTEDSRYYESRTLSQIEDLAPTYEYEPDTSGDLEIYIDNDCISWRDVENFLDNIAQWKGGTVRAWARDAFIIEDLNSEEYEDWENNYYRELEAWLDDLEKEFPNYGEPEEEDEEDEL